VAFHHLARLARWALVVVVLSLVALPASGVPKGRDMTDAELAHLSQAPTVRYWMANPDDAPAHLTDLFSRADRLRARGGAGDAGDHGDARWGHGSVSNAVFNADTDGLPQNEESVSACRDDRDQVIMGTNDYRGLIDPEGNFTGWHFSDDGGRSLTKEGLLPPVSEGGTAERPSGGDPVDNFSEVDCDIFAASLNYDPVDPFGNSNGIGIYKTDTDTLTSAACGDDGAPDPDCWPTRRYAAFSEDPTHFLDKEWFDVGVSGDAGEVVWVTYSDFDIDPDEPNPAGFTAEIFAVRCDADLTGCTDPIPISEDDIDVQFSDVTIGPDGRVYVTWSQILGELEGTAQTFVHKVRVAEPGSTEFGPEHTIFSEDLAIPFGGVLHANDFRVATILKNDVKDVGGTYPRIYAIWDACRYRPLDTVCEEPTIWLSHSDDLGETWSQRRAISRRGDNYFPTIADDPTGDDLAAAWFTNRHDPVFHNRQDVEMVRLDENGRVERRQRITRPSNESEADPLLGGTFIGDYIEIFAHRGRALIGYNANYRKEELLGLGRPIPQQDNYLARTRY